MARLDKLLPRNANAILGTLKFPYGGYIVSDEETLAYLMKVHFPGIIRSGKKEASPLMQPEPPFAQFDPKQGLFLEIATHYRVRGALKSFSRYKFPVRDGMYSIFLQNARQIVIVPLVRLARASMTLGCVPTTRSGLK